MVHVRLIFNPSCFIIPITFEAITYSTVSLKSDDGGISREVRVGSLDFSSGRPT